MVLAEAEKRALPEYQTYGTAMLTMAVFAICITAPLGAVFINTLGPLWLKKTEPDEEKVFDAATAQTLRTKDAVIKGLEEGEYNDQQEIEMKQQKLE